MLMPHHPGPGGTTIVPTQRTPDACQKLQILVGRPAADNLLSLHGVAKGKTTCPCLTPVPRGDPLPGVYQAPYPAANSSTSLGFQVSLRCPGPSSPRTLHTYVMY